MNYPIRPEDINSIFNEGLLNEAQAILFRLSIGSYSYSSLLRYSKDSGSFLLTELRRTGYISIEFDDNPEKIDGECKITKKGIEYLIARKLVERESQKPITGPGKEMSIKLEEALASVP